MHAPARVDRMPRRTERVGIYLECRGGPLPHADTDFMDRAPDKTALGIMRPARGLHESLATDMIVSAVTVGLQDAFKVAQELFGTFSLPTHSKVEYHRSARPAVLPEVSLMIFSPPIVHLHSNGRFIGLDVGAAQ
jgi:hypothetical protein